MGFTYLYKFTDPNTFLMDLAQRYFDNRGPTVLIILWVTVKFGINTV